MQPYFLPQKMFLFQSNQVSQAGFDLNCVREFVVSVQLFQCNNVTCQYKYQTCVIPGKLPGNESGGINGSVDLGLAVSSTCTFTTYFLYPKEETSFLKQVGAVKLKTHKSKQSKTFFFSSITMHTQIGKKTVTGMQVITTSQVQSIGCRWQALFILPKTE